MGQVPVGVVGDGRIARHFLNYLSLLRLDLPPARHWSRRISAISGESPEETLQGCETIFVLIKDDAIEPFLRAHPRLTERQCIHFSGSLSTPLASGFHPLSAFGPDLFSETEYRSIHWVTSSPPEVLLNALPGLPNPIHRIAECDRARYHALCAMAGNFTTLLWLKLFDEFENRLGLTRVAALPFLERIVENLETRPSQALTGPLVRGDLGTIRKHLDALEGDSYQAIYQAFAEAYLRPPERGQS